MLSRRATALAVEKLSETGEWADPEWYGRSAELTVDADVDETTSNVEDTDSSGRQAVELSRL